MPMKSQAQRAYLHIHEPDVADEFEKATPKGKKLPKHVREMPHLDSDHGPVDLRIERYPIPQAGKSELMRDFQKTGLAGMQGGKWFHFKPDHTMAEVTPQQAAELPRLPDDWGNYAIIASGDTTPRMADVFKGGGKK